MSDAALPPTGHWKRIPKEVTNLQGEDMGRIVALSDGVFAFALTLLVLSLVVPTFPSGVTVTNGKLGNALGGDWYKFLGYGFTFLMIGIWWNVHNRTYQYIQRYDSTLVWLNMAMLLQIAVMPFVLNVYTTYSNLQYAIDLFAGLQVGLGLTTTLTWEYALRAHLVTPNLPKAASQYFTRRGYASAAVFAASIAISFVSVEGAQLAWIAIFVVQRALTIEGT